MIGNGDQMLVITGATGHIGNNLVRMLIDKNIKFKVLLRKEGKELDGLEIEKYIGNLYDPAFYEHYINKNDTVIHIAGYIDLLNKDYNQSYQANYEMTKVIADECLKKEARLIYISSTDVLKYNVKKGYYIEKNIDKIKYNYPKTKTMATLYVQELRKKGLNSLILYPTAVIGINDSKGSQAGQEIINATKKRVLPYVKGAYDFIDVLDIAKAIIIAAEGNLQDDIVLSGVYLTIKDIYKIIAKLTNKRKTLIYVPRWLAKIGTYFMKDLSPMMIEIVGKAKPFNDPKRHLLIENLISIEDTFLSIINETN